MKAQELTNLLTGLPVAYSCVDSCGTVTGIALDSRKVSPGNLFVALRGAVSDGHRYLFDAVRRGAVALLIDMDFSDPTPDSAVVVRTAHIRRVLSEISDRFFQSPWKQLKMLGVTGTNGKTTTSTMIHRIFNALNFSAGLIGTVGARIGSEHIPMTSTTPEAPVLQSLLARMHQAGLRSAVMEVSSHSLALDRVYPMEFDVCVFTNLTRDHLDFHGSLSNYREAKRKLFTRLVSTGAEKGIGVINGDDPAGEFIAKAVPDGCRTILFGLESGDVTATDIRMHVSGSDFTVCTPWGNRSVHLPIPGRHNILNFLAALASVRVSGPALDDIVAAAEELRVVPGRMEPVDLGQPFLVVVDYAHTPDAIENLVTALNPLKTGRLILVFGCGGDRDRGKRPQMARAATSGSDLTIITSDNPRTEDPMDIIQDILPGVYPDAEYRVEVDRRSAIFLALSVAQPGDIVAIAGKGHEDYQEIQHRRYPFDDRIVAREALGELGFQSGKAEP